MDPINDVRKAALSVLQNNKVALKTKIFTEKVFDSSEVVRAEAFEGLAKTPMSRIKSRAQREKILYWGLTQPSGKLFINITNLMY